MANMMNIKAILFDLAGVLLDFRGPDSISELSNGLINSSSFDEFWSRSKWAIAFTKGACTAHEFAQGAVEYFRLALSPETFLENYRSWYKGPYPGALDLIGFLKPKFRVACLSNTNVIDVPKFREELKLHEIMDECLFSNEIGYMKPEKEVFSIACEKLALTPDQILLIDDNQNFVDASIEFGMAARRADGVIGATKELLDIGLISELFIPHIVQAKNSNQIEDVRHLFREYEQFLSLDLSFQNFEDELAGLPWQYSPPDGALLIAIAAKQLVGCVALRKLADGVCEMKRLFVRPPYRGHGFGRLLADRIVKEAFALGYKIMRLDTLDRLKETMKLYESLGFRRRSPYYDNPLPGVIYWELDLSNRFPKQSS
jgi:putative acetyltransferase